MVAEIPFLSAFSPKALDLRPPLSSLPFELMFLVSLLIVNSWSLSSTLTGILLFSASSFVFLPLLSAAATKPATANKMATAHRTRRDITHAPCGLRTNAGGIHRVRGGNG